MFAHAKTRMPDPSQALPGRDRVMPVPDRHLVLGRPLLPPFPAGCRSLLVGMGCFWGAERRLWSLPGIWVTAVGYAGGFTPNPTYEEVCSGMTGHNEVVQVVFDPVELPMALLLRVFWESHDPTQGMRQGNDVGTQYRSGLYVADAEMRQAALDSRQAYGARLAAAGMGMITTEIVDAPTFYYAEAYHQQYLARNPHGYCGLAGTGISCG
ncbi:MAG: peptide-methionine (S)-S-oxide [Rhodospirillaceae bacterium]|nr:MAG: peptide-methionine (S)-S-oxide [Rhodospirillaceae bacterium]TNC97633.1 MAG: peptide-methionine (S)-S-oxide reductase [Stygiobacter sp.]